jgi:hypothetical protein
VPSYFSLLCSPCYDLALDLGLTTARTKMVTTWWGKISDPEGLILAVLHRTLMPGGGDFTSPVCALIES